MKHAAFISHAGEERKLAIKIVRILESSGVTCWISRRDIAAGDAYGKDIIDALENSRICIVILSRLSNLKPGVHNEVERAFSKRIPMICFRIEDVQPSRELEYFISSVQWVDAWGNRFNQGVEELKFAVAKHLQEGDNLNLSDNAGEKGHESHSAAFSTTAQAFIRSAMQKGKACADSWKTEPAAPGSVRLSGWGKLLKRYTVIIPPPGSTGTIILGRSPGSRQGVISHERVTRRHAVLKWLEGDLCICDNGSLNGTFVNGTRLKGDDAIALRHGDIIHLGPVKLRVNFC